MEKLKVTHLGKLMEKHWEILKVKLRLKEIVMDSHLD